ncbi:putative dehydrogenase [Abditibacterium utsteinense]|uniref:Putative dehydrogenase n=1 Tax=Abditibacterium utsteinense TaxID=1960156 RepID=A0A2S8ST60_9BACT|nr:Gfo/Idh/MocA family oxidoreductase [Abditibacterium utsteinense]PQV63993.1 putative dehydrogenase [Abditibacterium utsteinense]
MSKIKMAILGCGGMSGEHAKRYKQHSDVEIVALCDVSEEIVQKYIDKNLAEVEPKPQIFTDFDLMLDSVKPDAVTIVTPHTMHFEHGMKAIAHGCHVFMEKPMVTDSKDAKVLKKAVEESGKVFVVGYNASCTPAMQWLREAIRNNTYGKLETVTGWQTQGWAKGTVGSWRQNPALSGGGQMYDSGAHMFNSLVWSVESPVESVFSFIDNVGTPVDINGTVNIRFQNGVLATMTIAGNCTAGGGAMVYTFETARVEVDGWNGNWIKVFKGWGEEEAVELPGEKQLPNDNFIDAILGRAKAQTSPTNGLIQSQLMDAIYESARTGAPSSPVND